MYKTVLARQCVLALAAFTLAASAWAQGRTASPEPEMQSYSIDTEVKLLTDRKSRGVSDTFNRPGAELTLNAAHESGLIGRLQLATVSKTLFPESNRTNLLAAVGYRGGDPDGWHYGAGIAREWFPQARATDVPTGFDEAMQPTGTATSRFHTSYLVGELGWGIVNARYLYVLSRDYRGLNTSTICAGYLPAVMAGGDPTAAFNCYGPGMRRTGGSHLLDFDIAYPLDGQTRLLAHVGLQAVRNFSVLNTVDYSIGLAHKRWGLTFGAEVTGVRVRDRSLFTATDASGNTRRLDRTMLILSVAKQF